MKDYYYILGINNNTDEKGIKSAYRKLSLKFHPDKNDGDKFFEERFKEIQEAYEVLSCAQKKSNYDKLLKNKKTETTWGNFWAKEEELKKREEEIKRKEEELKKKYQTPEEKRKEFEEQLARKKADEQLKLKKELQLLEELLNKKKTELYQTNEIAKKLKIELNFIQENIQKLKNNYTGSSKNNYERYKTEEFEISKFPELTDELKAVRNLVLIYDLQVVREIFIQFTKKHSIEQKYFAKNNKIIDLIVHGKIPSKQTEKLFRLYKENEKFINSLEKEICRIITY